MLQGQDVDFSATFTLPRSAFIFTFQNRPCAQIYRSPQAAPSNEEREHACQIKWDWRVQYGTLPQSSASSSPRTTSSATTSYVNSGVDWTPQNLHMADGRAWQYTSWNLGDTRFKATVCFRITRI
ncbi:hypothetical protein VTK56DRAFT_2979 [Thermocarpiscus australiensis]